MKPLRLGTARAWRTYLGGSRLREMLGQGVTEDDHFPEEWLFSTVRARNAGREEIVEGLTPLYDGSGTLAEMLARYPEEMLGKRHYGRYGASLGFLFKLIDAAERLTVQVHPTKEQARALFSSPYGKTECWHILGARSVDGEPPCLYFGFREGVTRREWEDCFRRQDIEAMLACLHKLPARVGDTYLIEGGVPHAIGAGCFLAEIQEPTDYTIRTERTTPRGLPVADLMCHQGLGFSRMFDCFTYGGATAEETRARYCIPQVGEEILTYRHTPLFSLSLRTVDGVRQIEADGGFRGLYVLGGTGTLDGVPIAAGDQYFIPATAETFTLTGSLRVLECRGPRE